MRSASISWVIAPLLTISVLPGWAENKSKFRIDEESIESFHPLCAFAYSKLPINTAGQARIDEGDDFRAHVQRYSKEYLSYDNSCFFGLASARSITISFVAPNVGAIFDQGIPECSGFLVGPKTLVTAMHCLGPRRTFRTIDKPELSYDIMWREGNRSDQDLQDFVRVSDINDWAVVPLDRSVPGFSLKEEDFELQPKDGQAIAIFAVNRTFFESAGINQDNWTDSVRFSRVRSSQIWTHDTKDSSESINAHPNCLLHRAPTFQGMSGAPMVAVHQPVKEGELPNFSIVGIHIADAAHQPSESTVKAESCGNNTRFNIGLRILPEMLVHLNQQ